MKLFHQPLTFFKANSAVRLLLLFPRRLSSKPLKLVAGREIYPHLQRMSFSSIETSINESEAKFNLTLQSIIAKYRSAEIMCAVAEAEIQGVDELIAQHDVIGKKKASRVGSGMSDAEAMLQMIVVKYQFHKRMRAAAADAEDLAYAMNEAAIIESGDDVGNAIPTLQHLNVVYETVRSHYASAAEGAFDLARIMPQAEAMCPVQNEECFHADNADADSKLRYLVAKYRAVNLKCSEAEASVKDLDDTISQAGASIGKHSFSKNKEWIAMHEAVKSMHLAGIEAQELVDQFAEARDSDDDGGDLDTAINILIRLIMKFRKARDLRLLAAVDGNHVYSTFQKLIASNPFYPYTQSNSAISETTPEEQDDNLDEIEVHRVDNSVVDANLLLTSLIVHMSRYDIDDY